MQKMGNPAYLMQMPGQDVELGSSGYFAVAVATNVGPIDRVSHGVFTTVSPVKNFGILVNLQIDRLWQSLKEQFDVLSGGGDCIRGGVDTRTENPSLACFAGTLLGPVEFATLGINGYSDTLSQVNGIRFEKIAGTETYMPSFIALLSRFIEIPSLNQNFMTTPVKVDAVHTHALPVREVDLLIGMIDG